MSTREYIISELDNLPESVLDKVQEFILFQKFSMGVFDDDTDYLTSIPSMKESILEGKATPLSDCVPLSEVWPDV